MITRELLMKIALGLMSGTSMDGIDVALIETDGLAFVREIGHLSTSYPPYVRTLLKAAEDFVRQGQEEPFERALLIFLQKSLGLSEAEGLAQIKVIKDDMEQETITFADVERLSTTLHREAVEALLQTYQISPESVDVIGYHGQTLYHSPQEKMSLQIGDGQTLATAMGIKVVNNFRLQDIQAGGQGAPFAPLYHQALAVRDGKIPVAVVNCGGISNITIIRDKDHASLQSYDPGPGNSLIDQFVALRTKGKLSMDVDGQFGSRGRVHQNILEDLWNNAVGGNYLNLLPPKSLDIGQLRLTPSLDVLSLEDGCATLENFTAEAIVRSLDFVKPPYPKYWILAGGGWYNPVIKQALADRLYQRIGPDVRIETAEEAGWNNRALEAQIFAYLAVRHLKKRPTSYPATTGASMATVGGTLFLPETSLVDLAQVATEQKDPRGAIIERLSLADQCATLFKGMAQATQVVKANKASILSAVEHIKARWVDVPREQRQLLMVGAGTSGRLGAITAFQMKKSPDFQVSFDIAGGVAAFSQAVEGAEDNEHLAQTDAARHGLGPNTVVFCLSASGRTPYALAYLEAARQDGALTIAIDNTPLSPLSQGADCCISLHTGPECPRGSTRMKAGTSQYTVLQLLMHLLEDESASFERWFQALETLIQAVDQEHLARQAQALATHFQDPLNQEGRLIYRGRGVCGLLGVVDGAELQPTYSWSRVRYDVPALATLGGQENPLIEVSPQDFVIELEGDAIVVNMFLKTVTTVFAFQSGWIVEGEMINLDPHNMTKKLVARRVQILKNLKIAQTDAEAIEILTSAKNNIFSVLTKRADITRVQTKYGGCSSVG